MSGCREIHGGCRPEKDCGCDYYIDSFACIRYTGPVLPCLNIKPGDTLQDVIESVDSLICNVPPGEDGLSAYEIAIQEGFEGSIEEWLESLKGEDGEDGQNGLSAYEVWLDQGNEGTEQDFFDSLCNCEEDCQNVFDYLTYSFNIL